MACYYYFSMKKWLLMSLVLILVGCASPYRPVYVSNEGDYYIEEKSNAGGYFGTGSIMYADVGFYPWWASFNHPLAFDYYSPYFYPYYFSIWYPPGYPPFYGYPRGYFAYWHRPHRGRWNHHAGSGAPYMPLHGNEITARRDLLRTSDNRSLGRGVKNNQVVGYKANTPAIPGTSLRRPPEKPYTSLSRTDSGRPAGSMQASPRSRPASRSSKNLYQPSLRDKQ